MVQITVMKEDYSCNMGEDLQRMREMVELRIKANEN